MKAEKTLISIAGYALIASLILIFSGFGLAIYDSDESITASMDAPWSMDKTSIWNNSTSISYTDISVDENGTALIKSTDTSFSTRAAILLGIGIFILIAVMLLVLFFPFIKIWRNGKPEYFSLTKTFGRIENIGEDTNGVKCLDLRPAPLPFKYWLKKIVSNHYPSPPNWIECPSSIVVEEDQVVEIGATEIKVLE